MPVIGRARGPGSPALCLGLLALALVAIFSLSPTHAQLEVAEEPSGEARSQLLARKRETLLLRKREAREAPLAAPASDPTAYVPPTDPGEDGGLFDMSTP